MFPGAGSVWPHIDQKRLARSAWHRRSLRPHRLAADCADRPRLRIDFEHRFLRARQNTTTIMIGMYHEISRAGADACCVKSNFSKGLDRRWAARRKSSAQYVEWTSRITKMLAATDSRVKQRGKDEDKQD